MPRAGPSIWREKMNLSDRYRLPAQILFWLMVVTVVTLALLPGRQLPGALFDWWDKAQHFVAFLVLTAVGLIAYQRQNRLLIATGLAALGLAIELIQASLDWRYGDATDLAADCLGIAAALLAFLALERTVRE